MIRFCILIISFSFTLAAYAQNSKGAIVSRSEEQFNSGNTFALIIGISKYQNFPSLQFADVDAIEFYNFLCSQSGGIVDSSNIRIILNENARSGDIWRDISWLTRKAVNKGDRVFIYFSGHGDAANEEEAYLLAHDAPNGGDPNLYNSGGTFQVYNLKQKIKQMTSAGVQVVLITDACRSNELPGKNQGAAWTLSRIMEKQSGEIQMTSCAANEQSIEGKNWGNGRGVFSWYLLNGLYGMADDDPLNGNVTLYEIEKYVKSNVKRDTKPLPEAAAMQNPTFCCSDKENINLSKADEAKKNKILAGAKLNPVNVTQFIAMKTRGVRVASTEPDLSSLFYQSIKDDRLTEPDSGCAFYYFNKLNATGKLKKDEVNDYKEELVAALTNSAQQTVNHYLKGVKNIAYTESYFIKAAKNLAYTKKFIGRENPIYIVNERNRLILESRAAYAAYNQDNPDDDRLKYALAKLDSARMINSEQNPLIFHTYGLIYLAMKKSELSIQKEITATLISPKWVYPYLTLAEAYLESGNLQKAEFYYTKALKIDTSSSEINNNIGCVYYNKKMYPQAEVYFKCATAIDSNYARAYNNLGLVYKANNKPELAEKQFLIALKKQPSLKEANDNMGNICYDRNKFTDAISYYRKSLNNEAPDQLILLRLSGCYAKTSDNQNALKYLDILLKNGFTNYDLIRLNPDFEKLRNNSDYLSLLKKYTH